MAQQVKGPVAKPGNLRIKLEDLQGRRRELIPASCPLTSTCVFALKAANICKRRINKGLESSGSHPS